MVAAGVTLAATIPPTGLDAVAQPISHRTTAVLVSPGTAGPMGGTRSALFSAVAAAADGASPGLGSSGLGSGERTAQGSSHCAGAAPGLAPRVAFHGPRDRKVVALTFDDGWAPWRVRDIFEVLVREHVEATFFVNAAYMLWAPRLWHRIAAAGYPIGNHTYRHVDALTITSDALVADLLRSCRTIEAITGRPMIPFFRPTYGDRSRETDRAAADAGFPTIVMWDTSDRDTVRGETRARALAAGTRGRSGSIVLLHAGPSVTPRILADLIASYRERGFSFVTIPELLGPWPSSDETAPTTRTQDRPPGADD